MLVRTRGHFLMKASFVITGQTCRRHCRSQEWVSKWGHQQTVAEQAYSALDLTNLMDPCLCPRASFTPGTAQSLICALNGKNIMRRHAGRCQWCLLSKFQSHVYAVVAQLATHASGSFKACQESSLISVPFTSYLTSMNITPGVVCIICAICPGIIIAWTMASCVIARLND